MHDREELPALLLVEPDDPRVLGEVDEEDLLASTAPQVGTSRQLVSLW